MNTIYLPKEVHVGIEELVSLGQTKMDIAKKAFTYTYGTPGRIVNEFASEHQELFLKAILNGYEVEKTPEDNLRDYYNALRKINNNKEIPPSQRIDAACEQKGIEMTLKLLDIKIEGVNAQCRN
jgi:hypothetical protein